MSTVIVTKHAMKRAHQRFSLPRRSVKRQAINALSAEKKGSNAKYKDLTTLSCSL